MTRRWYLWLLAVSPASLGIAAFSLGLGDLRSSGLMAGVGLTIACLALMLLSTGRWRRVHGVRRLAAAVPIALLGLVGLLGVLLGAPELAQARLGWFITSDAHGARSIVVLDGAFVVVGDDHDGALMVRSADGRAWTPVSQPPDLADLEMRDALVTDRGVLAIGQPSDAAVAQVLESRDGVTWHATTRFGHDVFGIAPTAVAAGRGIVAVGDIYGNDAVFFHSDDGRRWIDQAPSPVFDDGESARDVACVSTTCVAVGERTTNGGLVGQDRRRAIAWSSPDGGPWLQADGVFGDATVRAVTAADDGFVAVGHDEARDRAMVWTSPDGRTWTPDDDPPPAPRGARIDGVAIVDGTLVAFGRHDEALVVWMRTDSDTWRRSTVDDAVAPGSRIRGIASNGATMAAAGVDASGGSTAVWTSDDGQRWRRASLGPAS